MSYTDTFIKVAEDCPIKIGEIPVAKKAGKPAHVIQYELLTDNPYTFDHEGLIYEVYLRQKEIPANISESEAEEIKAQLFSKGHPCLRVSALTKRYGWGAHYNEAGKIALYAQESADYKKLMESTTVKKVPAMKSKR